MSSPDADIDIDAGLVAALLLEQHADLAALPLTALDAGFDNSMWRLGDHLVVRLPRRSVAVPLAIHEQTWLPVITSRLPLAIPTPVRIGVPSGTYPWPWTIVPWIEGTPGDRAALTDAAATDLGRFLAALHQPAPPDAPRNPFRGVALAERAGAFEDRLGSLASTVDVDALRRVWREACSARRWGEPPVWLHGDLHPANVLVQHGALAGVIDFGDICAGDPATDLAAAWMLFPTTELAPFLCAYGRSDASLVMRARGWAVQFGLLLLGIGLSDKPTYEPIARATLARAVLPWPGGTASVPG